MKRHPPTSRRHANAWMLSLFSRTDIGRCLSNPAWTELLLQRGDLEHARLEARRFVETRLATAERTWQALAWKASARVALAGSDFPQGQDCIRNASGLPLDLFASSTKPTALQHERRLGCGACGQECALQQGSEGTFLSSRLKNCSEFGQKNKSLQ